MAYHLSEYQIQKLKGLVGEQVLVSGSCIAEDEFGVAHHCPIHREGKLVDILSHEPATRRVDYLVLDIAGFEKNELNIFNLIREKGDTSWDFKKGLYHNGKELFGVGDIIGEHLPSLNREGTQTYLEDEFLKRNGLTRLLE